MDPFTTFKNPKRLEKLKRPSFYRQCLPCILGIYLCKYTVHTTFVSCITFSGRSQNLLNLKLTKKCILLKFNQGISIYPLSIFKVIHFSEKWPRPKFNQFLSLTHKCKYYSLFDSKLKLRTNLKHFEMSQSSSTLTDF